MLLDEILIEGTKKAIQSLFGQQVDEKLVQVQETRKEFDGERTIVVFPFTKLAGKSPEDTGKLIGDYLKENLPVINDYNVVKGFLNLSVSEKYWLSYLSDVAENNLLGELEDGKGKTIMIEFSSPNTNKPLHLGHIRNNLLGDSVSRIYKANGYDVVKVNLVNDRGVHISKSMLGWMYWGEDSTPESAGIKGDKFVGDYYVRFEKEYRAQVDQLVNDGMAEDEAKREAPLMKEAQELLRKWEAGEEEVVSLWKKMNGWVYDGFDVTYNTMGISFDQMYYESDTYLLGKKVVEEGEQSGVLYRKEDGSIWINLEDDGMDQKLLLRSDGTSVYMTQDIGTAIERFESYKLYNHTYVVGNEQDYHFKVLKIVLKKLGYEWSDFIYHLSYGMVELPEGQGKMKTREGTVVDADDLMAETIREAGEECESKGKLEGLSEEEKNKLFSIVGLGALKYFILKVDPKKKMVFDPNESVQLQGNTGPYIQYGYARISSLIDKYIQDGGNLEENSWKGEDIELSTSETELITSIYSFNGVLREACREYSPATIANFVYELVKKYNQFYHDKPVLGDNDPKVVSFRIALSDVTRKVIKKSMRLLGADVPERM